MDSFLKKKRYFAAIILVMVISGGGVGVYIVSSIYNVSRNYSQSQRLIDVISSVNKCTISYEEFLLNSYINEDFYKSGTNASIQDFDRNYAIAKNSLNDFLKNKSSGLSKDDFEGLGTILESFRGRFYDIVTLYKERGFKDFGVEGQMRKAVHDIEKADFLPDLEPLLSLRRHEKDFILRKDLGYADKLRKEVAAMKANYSNGSLNQEQIMFLNANLDNYLAAFEKIVTNEKQIGFTEKEGLRLLVSQNQTLLESRLVGLQIKLNTSTEIAMTAVKYIVWVVSVFFLAFLALITFIFFVFNNSVRIPVLRLREAAEEVSDGRLSVDISELKKFVLLNELVASIEKIILKFKSTVEVVQNIATNKNVMIDEVKTDNDEVGQTLNSILTQFNDMRDKEQKRAWHNEGLAMFAEIVRDQNTIKDFSDKTITALVKYLQINQAGLFVAESNEEDDVVLVLSAMYAFNRKKYAQKIIEPGQGLLGQCYLEKESMLLTEVPEGYTSITSGLGDASPRCIYVLVCKTKDKVEAIVELASFKKLEPYQIEFLEKVGENIASALYFLKVNENTSKLMLEFKHQAEILKSQEEEMRQNMEEMAAIQESMVRDNK